MQLDKAIKSVYQEYLYASKKFPPFRSPHEGYAIIKEELDELWDTIRKIQNSKERTKNMREEAIQISAMSLRFIVDLIEE